MELRDFVIHFELVKLVGAPMVSITALVARPSSRYYYSRHFLPVKMMKKSCDWRRVLSAFRPSRKENHPPRYLMMHCAFRRASWVMTTTMLPLDLFTKRAVAPKRSANLHASFRPPHVVATIIIDSDMVITMVVMIIGRLRQSSQCQGIKFKVWLGLRLVSTDLYDPLRFRSKLASCCFYDPYYYFEQTFI